MSSKLQNVKQRKANLRTMEGFRMSQEGENAGTNEQVELIVLKTISRVDTTVSQSGEQDGQQCKILGMTAEMTRQGSFLKPCEPLKAAAPGGQWQRTNITSCPLTSTVSHGMPMAFPFPQQEECGFFKKQFKAAF